MPFAVATAKVMPVQPMAVATAVPMVQSTVVPTQVPGAGVSATSPPGMWFESLCNCCYDWRLCCTAMWCSCITIPQLTERITGQKGSCKKWSMILASIMVLFIIFYSLRDLAEIFLNLAGITQVLYFVVATSLLCTVRRKVRHGDNIPPDVCGGVCGEAPDFCAECLDDCCCSCIWPMGVMLQGFWLSGFSCCCCTIVQMFHHLGIGNTPRYGRYTLGSPTGSDVVPSDYGPTGPYGVPPLDCATTSTASATGPSI